MGQVELHVTLADSILKENPSCLQRLVFRVADTGVGIPATELDTVFDAFVQSQSIDRTHQGTGLGLAISQQFVRLMGGDIVVRFSIGQTLFVLATARTIRTLKTRLRARDPKLNTAEG